MDAVFINTSISDPGILQNPTGKKVLLVGSAYKKEIKYLLKFIKENGSSYQDWIWAIVPHDDDKRTFHYYNMLLPKPSGSIVSDHFSACSNIRYINKMGILAALYQYSSIAFIGGGWGKGIHNIMEPAKAENAIIFGPYYRNSPEAIELIQTGAARSVYNYSSFCTALKCLLDKEEYRQSCGSKAKLYLDNQTGAAEICYSKIKVLLH